MSATCIRNCTAPVFRRTASALIRENLARIFTISRPAFAQPAVVQLVDATISRIRASYTDFDALLKAIYMASLSSLAIGPFASLDEVLEGFYVAAKHASYLEPFRSAPSFFEDNFPAQAEVSRPVPEITKVQDGKVDSADVIQVRTSEIDYIAPLVPIRGRLYDIFGIGAAIQGGAAIAGGIEQSDEAANSLDFQKQEFNQTQANEQPFLNAAYPALSQLSAGTAPGGALVTPYSGTFNPGTFTPPTSLTESNDPGFQARLQLGQQALEESEAAQGVTGGGALQAAEQYGQTFATNDYQNVYSNALNTYNANYQSGLGAFNTNYNVYANNQANQFNRLSTLAGLGQTSVGQLGQLGQAAATSVGNLNSQQGNALSAAGVGLGNAVNSGSSNSNNANLLQQILNPNGSGYQGSTLQNWVGSNELNQPNMAPLSDGDIQ